MYYRVFLNTDCDSGFFIFIQPFKSIVTEKIAWSVLLVKKVLVLGAGLVSKPLVDYLLQQHHVVVASRTVSKAEALIGDHPEGEAIAFDITKEEDKLDDLIAGVDLAISLLPYIYHVKVAGYCLKYKKHLVTTSYVSDAMGALDAQAKKAGVIFLNEIGVDPGIDHMGAMKIIHEIEEAGGTIASFRSYCGGLPAPEANTNPWGYKFSWSPRGVVLAARNDGLYREDGKEISVPNKKLFASHYRITVEGQEFEAYPNRDSLSYIETYGLEGIKTMYRGTLRNIGWCDTWQAINDLGFLDLEEREDLKGLTLADVMRLLTKAPKEKNPRKAVAEFLKLKADSHVLDKLEWLGLFSEDPAPEEITVLDILASQLNKKLQYEEKERDMLVLFHEFIAEYPKEARKEKVTAALIDYGISGGPTSMSRTVGLPAAIATKLILEGKIKTTGVHVPVTPEIYSPVLAELEEMNIKFVEDKIPI